MFVNEPADGFFEWGLTGAKTKLSPPTWSHATDDGVLLLAGPRNPAVAAFSLEGPTLCQPPADQFLARFAAAW